VLINQLRSEISLLMHDLSKRYDKFCVHESQKSFPTIFYPSQDETSYSGDSSKQATNCTDDTATSIWRPRPQNTYMNPVLAQISQSDSDFSSQEEGNEEIDSDKSKDEEISMSSRNYNFAG
jgi:hypothetical protein